MNSAFPAEGSQFITERYDLKGSTVGRECSEEEKRTKGPNAILKDLDLAREVEVIKSLQSSGSPDYGIHIGAAAKAKLLAQLRRDVKMLLDSGVMDYSLLVGVTKFASPKKVDLQSIVNYKSSSVVLESYETGKRRHLAALILKSGTVPFGILSAPIVFAVRRAMEFLHLTVSSVITRPIPYYGAGICGVDGGLFSMLKGKRSGSRAIFYISLIDFLQPWTVKKYLEREMKGVLGYDTDTISCVAPDQYAHRFLEFIDAHTT
eukprot:CAMPEP_0202476846 /NCGR_PEP_ID=MMETSP1360-20130828/93631_1 /ASSEMBLY_ACC=CAM_ASM_000848 /TAXON_ID=515479 /ORGANISM="Licmophora paradoxa, Strain CCMP2313" /LENGTH=261 /DNA_ID=CAMNT_0049104061 /DNA_START=145 /DNA_END=930 /DNA_ORIENTATION=-